MTNRQTMLPQTWVCDRHLITNEQSDPAASRENNSQWLSPMMQFKLPSENNNFGKLVSATINLIAYQDLKDVSNVINGGMNKCVFFDNV